MPSLILVFRIHTNSTQNHLPILGRHTTPQNSPCSCISRNYCMNLKSKSNSQKLYRRIALFCCQKPCINNLFPVIAKGTDTYVPESIAHMASGLTGLFSQVRKEGVKIMLCCCHTALIPWMERGQAAPEQSHQWTNLCQLSHIHKVLFQEKYSREGKLLFCIPVLIKNKPILTVRRGKIRNLKIITVSL